MDLGKVVVDKPRPVIARFPLQLGKFDIPVFAIGLVYLDDHSLIRPATEIA